MTLTPVSTTDLTPYTHAKLTHLTDGRTLYIPGSDEHPFLPNQPSALYRHPSSALQMPLLAGRFDTLLSDTDEHTWLVSLAHLAHIDCPACAATWTDVQRCLADLPPQAAVFTTVRTAGTYLLLHCEDQG